MYTYSKMAKMPHLCLVSEDKNNAFYLQELTVWSNKKDNHNYVNAMYDNLVSKSCIYTHGIEWFKALKNGQVKKDEFYSYLNTYKAKKIYQQGICYILSDKNNTIYGMFIVDEVNWHTERLFSAKLQFVVKQEIFLLLHTNIFTILDKEILQNLCVRLQLEFVDNQKDTLIQCMEQINWKQDGILKSAYVEVKKNMNGIDDADKNILYLHDVYVYSKVYQLPNRNITNNHGNQLQHDTVNQLTIIQQ